MTQAEFNAQADALAERIGVRDSHHGYFMSHRTRLFETCRRFGLFERDLGDVLEIGPFYSYTPILLRKRAKSYCVLEGDDSGSDSLRPLYQEHGVHLHLVNLADVFGSARDALHRLPFTDDSFDSILCWETMEHFGFNPVPFVRELWRITRPGGRLFLTVPNRASGEAVFSLLTNRNQRSVIDSYYKFADYTHEGRRIFLGFHWREYTMTEFAHLFRQAGFHIADQSWLMKFQDMEKISPPRNVARALLRLLCLLRPSFGKNCCLVAEKPASQKAHQANNS